MITIKWLKKWMSYDEGYERMRNSFLLETVCLFDAEYSLAYDGTEQLPVMAAALDHKDWKSCYQFRSHISSKNH
jgi:hypothetical protein